MLPPGQDSSASVWMWLRRHHGKQVQISSQERHNEEYTLDEVVANFFFHKLPAFTTVKPCTNPRYKDTCMFRSPYASIVSSKHQCLRDMQYTKIVKPTEHFKLLHPSQVPVWGFPGEDKLKEEGPGTRAPVRREQQLERRPQRDPQRERANALARTDLRSLKISLLFLSF